MELTVVWDTELIYGKLTIVDTKNRTGGQWVQLSMTWSKEKAY